MLRNPIYTSCGLIAFLFLLLLPSNLAFAQESTSIDLPLPPAVPLSPPPAEPAILPRKLPAIRAKENHKLFLALGAGTYVAAGLDMHKTMSIRRSNPGFHETDPLARPFTRLPAPAYYATGLAMATGLNWVSLRMARSQRWHRIWWLPQVCAIGGNLFGYIYSIRSE